MSLMDRGKAHEWPAVKPAPRASVTRAFRDRMNQAGSLTPSTSGDWIDDAVDELLATGLPGLKSRIRAIIEAAHAEGCK